MDVIDLFPNSEDMAYQATDSKNNIEDISSSFGDDHLYISNSEENNDHANDIISDYT